MAKSYSAIPGCYQLPQSTNSYYQTYQQQQQQQSQQQSSNAFNSPMAKSYSNFSQPVTPLFDASSILRCYSSAAIMQPNSPMSQSMTPLTSLPPLTPMPPMTPQSMTPPPMTPYDPSMCMYYQTPTPTSMSYMPQPQSQPQQQHQQYASFTPCQPTPMPMPLPILPLGAQAPPPSVQKYEFADFQPDLCCIGRHLKRLRDRYRSQFVVRIN